MASPRARRAPPPRWQPAAGSLAQPLASQHASRQPCNPTYAGAPMGSARPRQGSGRPSRGPTSKAVQGQQAGPHSAISAVIGLGARSRRSRSEGHRARPGHTPVCPGQHRPPHHAVITEEAWASPELPGGRRWLLPAPCGLSLLPAPGPARTVATLTMAWAFRIPVPGSCRFRSHVSKLGFPGFPGSEAGGSGGLQGRGAAGDHPSPCCAE